MVFASILFLNSQFSWAQDAWSPEQMQVLEAMEQLSAATAPGGAGADAYGEVLAEDFSRWTVGSTDTTSKNDWVEGVREWFDDGWRVSDREIQILEILMREDTAYIRRIVTETYAGPDEEQSVSTAALAEVWVRGQNGWLLLYVNVHPMDSP